MTKTSSAEIENDNPKNPTGVYKGSEAEYGKKEVYNGVGQTKEFGSESVHNTDFRQG